METRGRSDERGCARGKREPGGRADAAGERADPNELNRQYREHLSRDGGAIAERAKPVTKRAVFGCGWLRLGRETRVVIGVPEELSKKPHTPLRRSRGGQPIVIQVAMIQTGASVLPLTTWHDVRTAKEAAGLLRGYLRRTGVAPTD